MRLFNKSQGLHLHLPTFIRGSFSWLTLQPYDKISRDEMLSPW